MKRIFVIILNIFVFVMSFLSWIFMAVFSKSGASLTAIGFSSLKFFTVLSNLLNGIACLTYAFKLIKGKGISFAVKTFKLTATGAVGLTFITVVVFLGPLYGYGNMFKGANLWMHLILPVASILSFIFLERDCKIPFRCTLFATLPPFFYSIGYILNCILNGIGTWPDTNDFYGFLLWGWEVGICIAVTIVLITWAFSLLVWRLGKARFKK